MTQNMSSGQPGSYQELVQKYGEPIAADQREEVRQRFDTLPDQQKDVQRLSKSPAASSLDGDIAAIYKEVAGIQLELAKLSKEEGILLGIYHNTLAGTDVKPNIIQWINLLLTTDEDAKLQKELMMLPHEVRLEKIINSLGENVSAREQRSYQVLTRTMELRTSVVEHIKYLSERLVTSVRTGNYSGRDLAIANQEAAKIQGMLVDTMKTLETLEAQATSAREAGNLDQVMAIASEMDKVISYQAAVLDNKVQCDETVARVRATLLDSRIGADTAKDALARSLSHYISSNALVDAANKEFLYFKHHKDMMVQVYRHEAQITILAEMITEAGESASRRTELMDRLHEVNQRFVENALLRANYVASLPGQNLEAIKGLYQQHYGNLMAIDEQERKANKGPKLSDAFSQLGGPGYNQPK